MCECAAWKLAVRSHFICIIAKCSFTCPGLYTAASAGRLFSLSGFHVWSERAECSSSSSAPVDEHQVEVRVDASPQLIHTQRAGRLHGAPLPARDVMLPPLYLLMNSMRISCWDLDALKGRCI